MNVLKIKEPRIHALQSIKVKIPLYISILCIVVSVVLVTIFTQKSFSELKVGYEKRSMSIAINISNELKYGLLTEDKDIITKRLMPQFEQPDILYISVVNNNGDELVGKYKKSRSAENISQLITWAVSSKKPVIHYADDNVEFFANRTVIEAMAPVYINVSSSSLGEEESLIGVQDEYLGVVRVGLSLAGIEAKRKKMVIFALIIISIVILLSSIIAYFLAKFLVDPIINISAVAGKVADGNIDDIHISEEHNRMTFSGAPQILERQQNDELGHLTSNFIRMTKRIKDHHNELEAKVLQRTDALCRSVDKFKKLKYQADVSSEKLIQVNETLMLYRHSIESTSDSILITDSSGNIMVINAAFTKLSGYQIKDVVGKPIYMLLASKVLNKLKNTMRISLASKGEWKGETFFCNNEGTTYPVELSITSIGDEQDKMIANVMIYRDITQRVKLESGLKKIANEDVLTGLFNRRRFQEELTLAIARCKRYQTKLALLWIDVDRFKEVNDTLGHQAGDTLLCTVASALLAAARDSEIVARIGGDEFALIMSVVSEKQAYQGAERIINQVRNATVIIKAQPVRVTISLGVSIYPEHGNDSDELLAHADVALYQSKTEGRNKFSIYQPVEENNHYSAKPIHWKGKICDGIENNKFIFYAQPVIDVQTRCVCHYELLIRMLDDNGEVILPGEFINHAERNGMIREIDYWVIVNSIKLLATVSSMGYSICCAINLSAQTLSDDKLLPFIHEQLETMNIEPRLLMFEITEGTAISDFDKVVSFIDTLSKLGCQFALDDFGSGFTSFSYLKKLNVDYLKLDGSFIHNLPNEPQDRLIIEGMINMAKGLDMKVIAEWVENQETVEILTELGADQLQGFYTGKPMSIETLFKTLSNAD